MHDKSAAVVLLDLGDVVRDVVQDFDTVFAKLVFPGAPNAGCDDLPICKSKVRRCRHRAQIVFALFRLDGRAGELAIGQRDPIFRHRFHHRADAVRRHLVAEAAGAGVNLDDDLAEADAEAPRFVFVEHSLDDIDLDAMIAGADSPEWSAAALFGACGDGAGIGAVEATLRLDALQIAFVALADLDGASGTVAEDGVEICALHRMFAAATDTRWDLARHRVG